MCCRLLAIGGASIDYITLAALCVFFLKWAEPCLLLWDALHLFRKVTEIVVDEWAATRGHAVARVVWALAWEAGFCILIQALLQLLALWPQGDRGVCFPHLCSDTPLECESLHSVAAEWGFVLWAYGTGVITFPVWSLSRRWATASSFSRWPVQHHQSTPRWAPLWSSHFWGFMRGAVSG